MTSSMIPGAVLGGRYRLDDLLDDIDGARFWRATDTVLARSVAVHALDESDPRVDAMLEGARVSATVTDPHLLRVLDADLRDGMAWVINEWGTGHSLDEMISGGRVLPPDRAAWLVREVAASIAVAHRQGIAHGRLVPENVMVTESGTVRLIGFAIDARLRGDDLRNGNYPEADDVTSDLFDLVGLLYAGLVGRWPGASSSAVPAAPRDGHGPLRPRQVRAGVPRPLDAICDRVLTRPVPGRTAHQLAAVLTEYIGELATADPGVVTSSEAPLAPVVLDDPDDGPRTSRTSGHRTRGNRTRHRTGTAVEATAVAVPVLGAAVAATEEPEPDPVARRLRPRGRPVGRARAGAHRALRGTAGLDRGRGRRPRPTRRRPRSRCRRSRSRSPPTTTPTGTVPRGRRATPTTAAAGAGRRAAAVRPRGHPPYAQGRAAAVRDRRLGDRRRRHLRPAARPRTTRPTSRPDRSGPSARTPTSSPTTGRSAPAATGCAPR